MYLDTNGNTYDTAQEALDDFLSDLPYMTEEEHETVFQFTLHTETPEFNLKAIQQGITYAGLDTTVFAGYPVPVYSPDLNTLEVCLDCHLQHHTGDTEPNTSPWSLLAQDQTVTDNTTCAACFAAELDCEHNTISFSHSYCEGCGNTLAGERFTYALWA